MFLFGTGGGGVLLGRSQAPSVRRCCPTARWPRGYLIIPTLVAGTALLMWMGELISQRGIGNGMSMLIFASVVSGMPYGFYSIILQEQVDLVLPGDRPDASASSWPSCSSSSGNGEFRCSSPNVWSAGGCTAARTPTSR